MKEIFKLLKDFHTKFNLPVRSHPSEMTVDDMALRYNLLEEELKELDQAFAEDKKVEMLDALVDLQYVLTGAVLQLGFEDVFEEAFYRVHTSNMSKLCNGDRELEDTLDYYESEKGVKSFEVSPVYSTSDHTKYLVKRASDGKVLKNVHYQAVDLSDLV